MVLSHTVRYGALRCGIALSLEVCKARETYLAYSSQDTYSHPAQQSWCSKERYPASERTKHRPAY